jgi:hypothetical protein
MEVGIETTEVEIVGRQRGLVSAVAAAVTPLKFESLEVQEV